MERLWKIWYDHPIAFYGGVLFINGVLFVAAVGVVAVAVKWAVNA